LGTQYTGRRQKNNNTENLNNEQHGPNKKNKIKNKQTNKQTSQFFSDLLSWNKNVDI